MDLSNYANYHIWAGDKIRAILQTVTEEEFLKELGEFFSYPTLRKHIEHILVAEEYCISFMDKTEKDTFNSEVEKIFQMTNEKLIQKWAQTDIKYAEMLREKNIVGECILPNFLGHEFTVSNMDFLLQYITHTTFHRGQVIIALKKLGKKVCGTDFLHYLHEIAPIPEE
ncbi:MAG TPA: DinB family protein [Candidatus Bathyarchaeia archaeon]|nr:DinB family protein [Candidatus Bathyarchaeia archaeon]